MYHNLAINNSNVVLTKSSVIMSNEKSPQMNKNVFDYESSQEEGEVKGNTIDITSDGDCEALGKQAVVTPKRKLNGTWGDFDSSSDEGDEDDEHQNKKPKKYPTKTIKIDGRTIVVTPAIKDRQKEYGLGEHAGREIPQNSKFLGHNENSVPEELKGKSVTLILHFNYDNWSENR